jgi:protein TonB
MTSAAASSQLGLTRVTATEHDVLAPVLDVGRDGVRAGAAVGLFVAFLLHGYVVVRVAIALISMGEFVREAREEAHSFFWSTYEVDTAKEEKKDEPPPVQEEEPPPEVEKEPDKAPLPQPKEDIYKEQPAAKPAQAPDLVTAKEDSQEPEEFYNVVDQDGSKGPISGKVSNAGDGTERVDPNQYTRNDGQKGGKGTGPATTAAVAPVDKSRPASLAGSTSWSCPFPPEADAEGRDSAVAVIVVTVRPDGSPQSVSVVQDPGAGFGRAARKCALGRRYVAGLDKDGQTTTTTTPPIRVKFSR